MSFIQIQAGKLARHRFFIPTNLSVRPTSDRVKMSIFGIIQHLIPGRVVIDLFAGSGAIGFESLSRGAGHAVFVEKDKRLISMLRQNSASLHLDTQSTVLHDCAIRRLPTLLHDYPSSVVFIDPPYDSDLIQKTLQIIEDSNAVSDLIPITECHHKLDLETRFKRLKPNRIERYGETKVVFWSVCATEV